MLSRILWVGVAGIAIVAGMAMQDGDRIFSWGDEREASAKSEHVIEAGVQRAIDGSFDKMQVVGTDGEEIDVPAETKRAMAEAVGELVKAEADLALARVGEDDPDAVREASARRVEARAKVDRLKAEIKGFERAAQTEHRALAEEIQREVREDVKETVREAVRN